MSDQSYEVTRWPLIEDGARSDRGWVHWARLRTRVAVPAEASTYELRVIVHTDETWALLWAAWGWDAAAAWQLMLIRRALAEGQDLDANVGSPASPLAGHDWQAAGDARDQELWATAHAAEAMDGHVWPTDIAANVWPGRSRVVFRWETEDVAGASSTLTLDLVLLRIAYAGRRRWTRPGVEKLLTDIAEMARRVD